MVVKQISGETLQRLMLNYTGDVYVDATGKLLSEGLVESLKGVVRSGEKVRVFYGNTSTGQSIATWKKTMGVVQVKRLADLVYCFVLVNINGGTSSEVIENIVKLTKKKGVVYMHPSFHIGEHRVDTIRDHYGRVRYILRMKKGDIAGNTKGVAISDSCEWETLCGVDTMEEMQKALDFLIGLRDRIR